MNKRRLLIRIIASSVIILAASIYYGLDSQYFGKTLESHIGATVTFIVVITLLYTISEWYNAKTRDRE